MALFVIAVIPLLISTFEVIFSEKRSVNFLGGYHPAVALVLISYYVLLLCLGIFWLVKKIIFINKLEHEKIKAELMLLKSQVSPHFFFNMLNNLYGLIGTDAQKARDLILKLSDMMRYSIYEGEKDTVTMQEEVIFLENYIALHKMRYHKNVNITFHCEVDGHKKIVPLLFIILLENAFKHGVESMRTDAYIRISLTTSESDMRFMIQNNYEQAKTQPGIGLKNLRRRLELTYPKRHDLTFSITESVYQAQLILKQL